MKKLLLGFALLSLQANADVDRFKLGFHIGSCTIAVHKELGFPLEAAEPYCKCIVKTALKSSGVYSLRDMKQTKSDAITQACIMKVQQGNQS